MDFDSALGLEDDYYTKGHAAGTKDGHAQGLIDGRIYGTEVAYERYFIIGQLYARVQIWKILHKSNARLSKHIEKVDELFRKVPQDNTETADGEDYESVLNSIIGKMKVIVSLTGEESLAKQGLVTEKSAASTDLEDGAELAVQLRGGSRKACAA